MSLFEKIGKLFTDTPLPEETKEVFLNTSNTKELLGGLDKLITRNELRLKQLNKELENREQMERADVKKIQDGTVSGRAKNNVLRSIKRMRRQLDNLEQRIEIYDKNISLHLNLIGKIQQTEAMSLAGVDEAQIDDILLDFETNLEDYKETMAAGEGAAEAREPLTTASDEELVKLEAEIKGEAEPEAQSAEKKELRELEKEIKSRPGKADKEKEAEAE